MKEKFIFFISTLLFLGCNSKESILTNSEWLIGTWQSQTSKGPLFETWRKTGENTFNAKSYYLVNLDTVLFETVELKEVENKLIYSVSAAPEKNEKPVSFTSIETGNEKLIFENKLHDFPQLISYKLISKDSLLAEISGKIEGKFQSEQFPMKKIK